MKNYVIANTQDALRQFLAVHTFTSFCPFLSDIAQSHLWEQFDTYHFCEREKSPLPPRESVANILGHIACWNAIAHDDTLADNEWLLISDATIKFTSRTLQAAEQHIQSFLNATEYDYIALHNNNVPMLPEDQSLSSYVFHDKRFYDAIHTQAYLIRKRLTKELTERFVRQKPDFLIYQPTHFVAEDKLAHTNFSLATPIQSQETTFIFPSEPLFSVVIPVYNVEKYLDECLQSVFRQDYQNYEIILVNDGSKDYSAKMCFEYAQKYPHITFISQPNQGLSDARNAGVKQAHGQYILFLDSDDYWAHEHVLSDLAQLVEQKSAPDLILTSAFSLRNNQLFPFDLPPVLNDNGMFQQTLESIGITKGRCYAWLKIVKRALFTEHQCWFQPKILCEDVLWEIKLAQHIHTYAIYPNHCYVYRRDNSQSLTNSLTIERTQTLFDLIRYALRELRENSRSALPVVLEANCIKLIDFIGYLEQCLHLFDDENGKMNAAFSQQWQQLQTHDLPEINRLRTQASSQGKNK